ncbi:class I SAM-dependent methyltransferase family protein [Candidatus Woesearchaeota archaeon]|nr:class I SAM-dependent methyltransferase family protein [Candidatus Woesearchaeota archaeon]
MLSAQTDLKNAQKVKEFLLKKNLIDQDYNIVKEMGFIYFPIKKKVKITHTKIVDTKFSFPKKQRDSTIGDLLKNQLTKAESKIIPKSQEVIGTILLLEIPEKLQPKEKLIAEAHLKLHKNIQTVVKKADAHTGEFRTRKVQILAGKPAKETIHLENKVKIKLNIEQVYFSARSAHERLRIAQQIKTPEQVLVMFSGAAPYPLVIAKNSPAKIVYGIEMNPIGHTYGLQNITLNNLQNKIKLYEGDVRTILPSIKQTFDRIIMPLPKTGEQFLDIAFTKAHKGTIIHLYAFLEDDQINNYAQYVKNIANQLTHKIKILRKIKCGQFSPSVFRVCLDIKVEK